MSPVRLNLTGTDASAIAHALEQAAAHGTGGGTVRAQPCEPHGPLTAAFPVPGFLATLPLFSDMTPAELERLAQGCQAQHYSRGETIFVVGQPCNEFHVAVTGQVKLYVASPTGQEKIIEIIGPGQSFAEALMFADRPYILNAQALTEALLLSVSKQAVLGEIARDARFALRMLAGVARRLHGLVSDVEALTLRSGVQRVIGYLLREQPDAADEDGRSLTILLPVSKATIASRLSLTPEYFSRVLNELETAGLISMDKREIHVRDIAALARYPEA